jgi:hypothetical protein
MLAPNEHELDDFFQCSFGFDTAVLRQKETKRRIRCTIIGKTAGGLAYSCDMSRLRSFLRKANSAGLLSHRCQHR